MVEEALEWDTFFSFFDSIPCGNWDWGNPSIEKEKKNLKFWTENQDINLAYQQT